MKRWLNVLFCIIIVFSALCVGGCNRNDGPLSLSVLMKFKGGRVEKVVTLFDELVGVSGEYKGKQGVYFVNTAGEVLADTAFENSTFAFNYKEEVGYYTEVLGFDGSWYELSADGVLSEPLWYEPGNTYSCYKYKEEVNGQELWGIRSIFEETILEPTYSWMDDITDTDFNYAVTSDGQPVLIDMSGRIRVTLPKGCLGVTVGDGSFVAEYKEDGKPSYRLLGFDGIDLSNETCEDLTPLKKCLSVGVQSGKIVLFDTAGAVCLRTYIKVVQTRGAIAFDGDTVAAVLANNTLAVYRITFDEEPLSRTALVLAEGAEKIEQLYNRAIEAYDIDMESNEYIFAGTVMEHWGREVLLETDYALFSDASPAVSVTNWAELEQAVESVFTHDVAKTHFYTSSTKYAPRFINVGGRVYAALSGENYCGRLDAGSVTILMQTEDVAAFSIREFTEEVSMDYVIRYYTMVKTDVGWRLDCGSTDYADEVAINQWREFQRFLRRYAAENGELSAEYAIGYMDNADGKDLLLKTEDGLLEVYNYVDGQVQKVTSFACPPAAEKLYFTDWSKQAGLVMHIGGETPCLQYLSIKNGAVTIQNMCMFTPDGNIVDGDTRNLPMLIRAKNRYQTDRYIVFRSLQ